MNPRRYRENGKYYDLEPPWFFGNHNVFDRIFQLKRNLSKLGRSLSKLEEIRDACEESGTDALSSYLDFTRHIIHIMESTEVFLYNFEELSYASWFGSFWQDVAHAYWRIEEGWFNDAADDEEVLQSLIGEANDILAYTSTGGRKNITTELTRFFEHYALDIYPDEVPSEYEVDVFEARDLYCLGYYSTTLLVLGRAVEKALLELGHARKVESIRAYNDTHPWEDTRFSHRNTALNRVNMPERHGKVLSQKEFHQIAILVDYRNNVAHSEYEDIDQDEARRQILDAYDLLVNLGEKIEYLKGLKDDKIEPVQAQKAQ